MINPYSNCSDEDSILIACIDKRKNGKRFMQVSQINDIQSVSNTP